MRIDRLWTVLALAVIGLMPTLVPGAELATVTKDKVNLRGQASLKGEVLGRLNVGETVTILEEIKVAKPKKGEPAAWAKIQLPANSTVWVFAPYVDATAKTVTASRVNLRGGPGENYSILGRIDRGAEVKEVQTKESWMEIEAPTNAFAFVALEMLQKAPPTPAPEPVATTPVATTTEPVPAPTPTPEPPPTTVTEVTTEAPPAAAQDNPPPVPTPEPEPAVTPPTETPPTAAPAEIPPATTTAEPTVPTVPPPVAPPPVVQRKVIREGRVVYSRSVQAPTKFALESLETHRLVNYLHTEQPGLKLDAFKGRKVTVDGEELLDARWRTTPILEVEDIRVVP